MDKFKEVETKVVIEITPLLRFIFIRCPIISYLREFVRDSWSLPQAILLGSLILGPFEGSASDSQELESCSNLFHYKKTWLKYQTSLRRLVALFLECPRTSLPMWPCAGLRWGELARWIYFNKIFVDLCISLAKPRRS